MDHSGRFALPAAVLLAFAGTTAAAPFARPPSSTAAGAQPGSATTRPVADAKIDSILAAMRRDSTWGHPDLFGEFTAMQLYSKGDYNAAFKYFEYGARYADKLSQLSIGLMYANGRGVGKDPVKACAWLKLAAQRNYRGFAATRRRVCSGLAPEQREQATQVLDKLLPVYGDAVATQRMASALRLAATEMTGSRVGFDRGVSTIAVNSTCGGATIAIGGTDTPLAGCGDGNQFWSPWRWDPTKYFKARDLQWIGTVAVGGLRQKHARAPRTEAAPPANESKPTQPVPASSAAH